MYDIRRIAEHRAVLTDKKLNAIYRQLEKDLKHFLADAYEQYADADGRLYVANLDAQRKKAWFLREIAKAVDSIAGPVKAELLQLVDDVYETCYKGMVSSLKSAHKDGKYAETVKDLSVNKEVFKRAIGNNVSKLTLPRVLEKNRSEVIYQIQQELNIGLLNGDRYEQMAKRISERVGVSRSKADNIVRTETHRNTEGGMMDSAERVQEGLTGSGLIYAATWHTMKDERVRPNVRRKTKKGWKTYRSKTKANHMKMEGKTVAVGELFDLGNGVKAKAPGESGDAANDCRCRCFLEYNLMTAEEFAKAAGMTVREVRKKYGMGLEKSDDSGIIELTDEETRALNQYIGSDAYKINEKLRNGEKLSQEDETLVKNLDSALDKMPNYEGNLVRVMRFEDETARREFVNGIEYGLKHKEKVTFPEYISTSCVDEYNPDANVKIYISNAKKGKDIRFKNPEEQEILYRRNSTFMVKNIIEQDGIIYIRLEE